LEAGPKSLALSQEDGLGRRDHLVAIIGKE